MPWSGSSGSETFSRTDGTRSGSTTWQDAEAASVDIVSDDHDTHDQDIADGVNACLKKDGGNTVTADIPMGGFNFTGAGDAAAQQENPTMKQIQNESGVYIATPGGTANALTATTGMSLAAYVAGLRLRLKPASLNTGAATLAVDGGAAKNITYPDATALAGGELCPGNIVTVVYDGTQFLLVGTSRVIKNYADGLLISNNGSDATNDIDIAAGSACDSVGGHIITLASGITKRLDAAWAVGTNQGGLDTGSIADTNYHVWLIKRSDTGVVDALFSASASAPTMPTSYDLKRRIGSIVRSGSTILAFKSYETGGRSRTYYWDVPIKRVETSNPGTSAVLSASGSPGGVKYEAILWVSVFDQTANAATYALFTSPDQTDTTPSSSIFNLSVEASAGSTESRGTAVMRIMTDTSSQIRYRLSQSTADHRVNISTIGWVDYI